MSKSRLHAVTLRIAAVFVVLPLGLAGCATAEPSGGSPASDAFDALLESNPHNALSDSGVDVPSDFVAACGDLSESYKGLASKTYKVAVSGDSPPLAYKDELDPNKLLGYHPAMAELTLTCLGFNFEYVFFDFAGLGPAMEAGRADIQWRPIFYSEERAAIMDFALYQQNSNDVMTAPDEHEDFDGFEDLCGLKLAVPGSSDVEARFLEGYYDQFCEGKPKIEALTFPGIAQMFQALAAGQVDALITSNAGSVGFSEYATTRFNDGSINFAGPSVLKGQEELLQALFESLKVVQSHGLQTALLEAYDAPANLYLDAELGVSD